MQIRSLMACSLALLACASDPSGSDTSESSTSTTETSNTSGTETTDTGTETTDTDGNPPLSNGPGGDSVTELGCAPDDGAAWEFTIGLGGACDMAQPDPSLPFVNISVYDGAFMSDPVGMTVEWTDWQQASGYWAPDGQNGMTVASIAGSLHIDSWEQIGVEGSTLTGWYTMSFETGDDIGASFVATYCGGSPMCG